jgi:aspartate ammonia-lyase
MFPLIAWDLCHMMEILTNAVGVFTQRCVTGIGANEARCRELVEKNVSIVTALNPYIGYAKAAEIGKEALETGKKIRDLVIEKKLLPKDKLEKIFDFYSMTEPNI